MLVFCATSEFLQRCDTLRDESLTLAAMYK